MSAPALTTAVDAPASAGDALRHAADTLLAPKVNMATGRFDLARRLNYSPADIARFEQDLADEALRLADMLHAATEMTRLDPVASASVSAAPDDATRSVRGPASARRTSRPSKWALALTRAQESSHR